jgi:hypothetical protein
MLDAPVGMTDRGSYLMLTLSVRRVLFSIGTVCEWYFGDQS